ncbi:MAG TPA: AAA family ATPase [Candidatus Xenobia bacterium]
MLTTFRVDGFKSFAGPAEIELGQINVFVGANGTGKSAYLEAIGVLGAAMDGKVNDAALLARGVRPGVPALYKSSFQHLDTRPLISMSASYTLKKDKVEYRVGLLNPIEKPQPAWHFATESVNLNGKPLPPFTRARTSTNLAPDTSLLVAGSGEMLPTALVDFIEVLSDYRIFCPEASVLRGIVADPGQSPPVGLRGGRLAEAIRDIAQLSAFQEYEGLLEWIDRVRTRPPSSVILSPNVPSTALAIEFKDRFMKEGRDRLLAYDASEGALFVLFLAVLAVHPAAPRLFAVDNFDHTMHPRLARAVIANFCTNILESRPKRQALLTTHNPLVLDGLDLRNDAVRLFAVERDSDGASLVRRIVLDRKLLEKAFKSNMPLSTLWVNGLLGGVPNV